MDKKIVTRIAPSPTGLFHVGTARTALFNYLYTRQQNGKFILRIEDTDRERSTKEYEQNILDGLAWLGIDYDEMFRQSERNEIYSRYIKKMIDSGFAYISKEKEEEGKRGEVIRFKNPNQQITFIDTVRGEIVFDTTELGDFVIAKSLEEPLYHTAVVIDDHEMGITNIIRGEDHISNTPRQILIQKAIGAIQPTYTHLPLILAPDKSKLSKRHGAVSVSEYKEQGFLPEAIINYLALLGWNPGTEKEIFSKEELIKEFSLKKIQKTNAVFDIKKLKWVNREFILKIPQEEILKIFEDASKKKIPDHARDLMSKVLTERSETLGDIKGAIDEYEYVFNAPEVEKQRIIWKEQTIESSLEKLMKIKSLIEEKLSENYTPEQIKEIIWPYAEQEGRGEVLWPFRMTLTGKDKSPDPFTVSSLLGKTETLSRIENILK